MNRIHRRVAGGTATLVGSSFAAGAAYKRKEEKEKVGKRTGDWRDQYEPDWKSKIKGGLSVGVPLAALLGLAYASFRRGRKFEAEFGYGSGFSYGRSAKSSLSDSLKALNLNMNIKTKREAKSAFRSTMRSVHPDRAPKGQEAAYTEKAKKVNEAWTEVQQSRWFNKLSYLQRYALVKKAAMAKKSQEYGRSSG